MANQLLGASLSIEGAVGPGPAAEFDAFVTILTDIPDLNAVVAGKKNITFPDEPSLRYASVMGLVGRCLAKEQTLHAFRWLINNAPAEWTQLFAVDLFPQLRAREQLEEVHQALLSESDLREFLTEFARLSAG